jgi:hypothetical protein
LYRDVKHAKKKKIPKIKTPDARSTEIGILSQGRMATRLYLYARMTKVKAAASICGYINWMGRGFSLQYRTC